MKLPIDYYIITLNTYILTHHIRTDAYSGLTGVCGHYSCKRTQ